RPPPAGRGLRRLWRRSDRRAPASTGSPWRAGETRPPSTSWWTNRSTSEESEENGEAIVCRRGRRLRGAPGPASRRRVLRPPGPGGLSPVTTPGDPPPPAPPAPAGPPPPRPPTLLPRLQ